MILREAIEKSGYRWQDHGPTLPDAMMDIFKQTGVDVYDPATGITFKRLDILAAVDQVMVPEPGATMFLIGGLLSIITIVTGRSCRRMHKA